LVYESNSTGRRNIVRPKNRRKYHKDGRSPKWPVTAAYAVAAADNDNKRCL
jgi:hypothetical protein